MKVVVCGGGNVAHSLAALISRVQDVCVLTRRPEAWSLHVNNGSFCVSATSDASAVSNADVVFVALPQFAVMDMVTNLTPHLHAGQNICFVPANSMIPELVDCFSEKGLSVSCLQRVPCISRIVKYGRTVSMSSPRSVAKLYVSRQEQIPFWKEVCFSFFDSKAEVLHSPQIFVLNNSNPILHPSRMVVLFHDWRHRRYNRNPLFYAEWTDESSELYIAADSELVSIAKVIDSSGACAKEYESVLVHYEVKTPSELTQKLRSIESFKRIASPMVELGGYFVPDFSSRYFTEDVQIGLAAIVRLGRASKINIPVIESLYDQSLRIMNA